MLITDRHLDDTSLRSKIFRRFRFTSMNPDEAFVRTIHTHFRRGAARAAEIAARDIAEWFVPIGAEGRCRGTKNREQSVLGQIGLMFLGIGSHQYNNQQREAKEWHQR
jgi:hypothetical protein